MLHLRIQTHDWLCSLKCLKVIQNNGHGPNIMAHLFLSTCGLMKTETLEENHSTCLCMI